jgi:outer membrane immunogenic protein
MGPDFMRKLALLAALAAFSASPAYASGEARVEIQLGYDDIGGESGVTYGSVLGYDMDFGSTAFAGVEVGVANSTIKELGVTADRDLSVSGRFGIELSERGKIYALLGYSNQQFSAPGLGHSNLDGIRVGAGYQHDIAKNLYGKVEYRYTNYELGVDRHTVVAGLGARF